MAEIKKINTEFQLLDKFLDTSGDAGTSGQVLSSTASGINWTTPTTGTVTGTGTTNRLTKFTDGANGVIGNSGIQDASNAIAITINGNEEVGINKTNPTRPLHVSGIAQIDNGSLQLGGTSSVSGNNPQLRRTNSSNDLAISTGGSDRITVLGTGNVGIGTTSPSGKLEVKDGSIRVTTFNSFSNLISGRSAIPSAEGYNLGGLLFQAYRTGTTYTTGAAIYSYADGAAWTSTSVPSYLSFHTAGSGSTNTSERMVIKSNGNVGIGTTSPGEKLEVDGRIKVQTSAGSLTLQELGTGSATIAGSGTVGIQAVSNFRVKTNSSNEAFTVLSTGNVGIGTTSPGSKLHVQGTSFFFDQAIFDDKVGIGTTSPVYKLDVNGGVQAGGKVTYTKSAGSLNTTGYAVAGLATSSNGQSAGFTFTCFGHTGGYQKIVYSCYNASGTWVTKKVINEGTNQLDVVASANGTTITFTFKSISGTMSYTPRVTVEAVGTAINSTYA